MCFMRLFDIENEKSSDKSYIHSLFQNSVVGKEVIDLLLNERPFPNTQELQIPMFAKFAKNYYNKYVLTEEVPSERASLALYIALKEKYPVSYPTINKIVSQLKDGAFSEYKNRNIFKVSIGNFCDKSEDELDFLEELDNEMEAFDDFLESL